MTGITSVPQEDVGCAEPDILGGINMNRKRMRFLRVASIAMILAVAGGSFVFGATKVKNSGDIWTKTGSHSVRFTEFSVNGRAAFCVERGKKSPSTGAIVTPQVYKKDDLDKYLYYGYQGPEQWKGFKSNKEARLCTSALVGYEHYSDGSFNWMPGYKAFKSYIAGKSKPSVKLAFDKTSVKTGGDSENGRLVSEIITVTGSEKGSLRMPIPKGMIYHNADTGKTQSSGDVTLKKGSRFYFEATDEIDTNKLYEVKAYNKKLEVTRFVTKSTSIQDLVQMNIVEDKTNLLKLTINWNDRVGLKIIKKDEDGNPVPGCKFAVVRLAEDGYLVNGDDPTRENIMKDKDKLDIVTVDENGIYSDASKLRLNQIYAVCETEAAEGYMLSDKVSIIEVDGKKALEEIEFINKKQSARLVILKKGEKYVFKDNKIVKEETVLEGAKFEIRKDDKLVETLVTDVNGKAESGRLDLGQYEVKEVEAPSGYILDSTPKQVNLKVDKNKAHLDYNLSFLNKSEETELKIMKMDKETEEKLEGAVFTLEDNDGNKLETTTGKDGCAVIKNIPEGEYNVKETAPPKGYKNDAEDQTVKIGGESPGKKENVKICSFYNTREKDAPVQSKPKPQTPDKGTPDDKVDAPQDKAETITADDNIPQTGDHSRGGMYTAFALISVAGAALLTAFRRYDKL